MSQVEVLIIKTIEHYYGTNELQLNNEAKITLYNFVNSLDTVLLQGYLQNDNELQLLSELQDIKKKCVIFYKITKINLNRDNFLQNVNIISFSNTAAESLYLLLKQIFSPLLKNDTDLYSSKLHQNLSELESNLMVVSYGKVGNECIILSVEDELNYWQALSEKKNASLKEKEAASAFCNIFQDICEEIRLMQSSPMAEMRESVENIGGLLDDLWRYNTILYPQEKMMHIFDVIGHRICSIIQDAFISLNIWKVYDAAKNNEILSILLQSLKVMQTWSSACQSLTEVYWPNYALHAWTGKSYVPLGCSNFQQRLKEVNDIRSIHNQLNKLLSKIERKELKTDALLEPYESVKIWICNGENEAWLAAKARFEINLRPVETKVAEKLKPRLHSTSTKQMLYEFMRYKTLIERPQVKQALNNELEIFVSSLLSMLKSVQNQLDSEDVDVRMHHPAEMSPLVHQVQWAKQMEAKVMDIHMCAEKYLNEYEGSKEVMKLADKLLIDLKTMYTQLHQEWSRELQAEVKSGSASVSGEKPVVSFSDGQMVVQFEPRLARAQLEARCLAALGLRAPPAAALLDRLLDKLRHARALQQVASFHNTLGERMIPSTRPMMLEAAMELSSLVQNHKAVYWDDTQLLDNYTEQLKQIVVKLESQNTYLTSQHMAIRNIVEQLLDTELLAKQAEWKKKVKDIRDIIEKVELNGYKNTDVWKTHWDWQLYKALECQYIKTLLSLHKHFPPVRVDLVLRNHEVRLQPPMEEIQVQHYNQLRRLVSMPAQFVGLRSSVGEKSIFGSIVEKHAWLGALGARRVGGALGDAGVERARAAWARRAALVCVPDLPGLCAAELTRPEHWEINFKACKAYGQAVAKMTFDDEKIDWIIVGTTSLRREFETQVRNLWASLMSTLQASCRDDATSLDAFIASTQLMLNDKSLPKNAKELSEISAKQQIIKVKMPEMEKTVEDLKRKSHMLHTWGGDVTVEGTIKEWQKTKELMTSHQQMFEHQAEIVKSSLSGEWENLKTSLETWVSRWSQSRGRAETRGVPYEEMVRRCAAVEDARDTWTRLAAERDELVKECEKFDMKLDIDKTWSEAEQLINEDVKLWAVFKNYDEEFSLIADQEWIVFQKKMYLLDEFTSKWKGQLEPYTTITLFLQQELEKYTDLTPLLKYVRGADFTERHWREVFGLLEMEYKTPDTLLVKDLLKVSSNIKKHIKALQQISTDATSESAVRSALNELEIWYAGARLNIIYYNDNAKRPVPIVKDYKDIIAKVEEQQWTVSSVGGAGSGGDACGAWGARLRSARALLHAAHHAQRRFETLETATILYLPSLFLSCGMHINKMCVSVKRTDPTSRCNV